MSSSTGKRLASVIALAAMIVAAAIAGYVLFAPNTRIFFGPDQRRYTSQFTASSVAAVFAVAFEEEVGLVFIDRASASKRLIYEKTSFLASPYLSADGQRLLFARYPKGGPHELLSCIIATWHCRVLLRTDGSIISPIELGVDTILYSWSPLVTRFDGRRSYSQHDLYLLEGSSQPVRLTYLTLIELHALNVVGGKVIFSAQGPRRENPVIPESDPLAASESDIFMLDFDAEERRIRRPTQMLKPLNVTMIGGYSINPSVSADGERIAFLNRALTEGRSRYNLAVGRLHGTVQKYIEASGIGFSQPAFVGNTVLVNELFDDRYEVKLFNLSGNSSQTIAVLEHSPRSLRKLERIEVVVEN